MFLEMNPGSVVDASKRTNILQFFEKREFDKMKASGYDLQYKVGVQDLNKVSYAKQLIERHSVTAGQRAGLS